MDHSLKGNNFGDFSITAKVNCPLPTISLQSMSGRGLIGLTKYGTQVFSALTEAFDEYPLRRVMNVDTFVSMLMRIVEDHADAAFWHPEKLDADNAKALLNGALAEDTEIISTVLAEVRHDRSAIMELVKSCAFSPNEGDDDSGEDMFEVLGPACMASRARAPVISMAEFKARRDKRIAESKVREQDNAGTEPQYPLLQSTTNVDGK